LADAAFDLDDAVFDLAADGDLNGRFLLAHCGDGRVERLVDRDRSR
jgi:hypothetical protein